MTQCEMARRLGRMVFGRLAQVAALVLLVLQAQVVAAATYMAQVTAVPDGDTLWVQPEGGKSTRKLRLLGIDAPEICQPGGVASRDALRRLTGAKRVRVQVKYHDVYGRGLARIQLGERDVGAVMVHSGHAWSARFRRSLGPYAREEAQARQARDGVFSAASPELPRDFRKRHGSCYPSR